MSVSEIGFYCHNISVVGSLKENERLLTNGRKFSKLAAPDRYLRDSKNFFVRIAHKIVTLVLKLFQALERAVRGEHAELNLLKIEEMTNQVLDGEVPDEVDENCYDTLRLLGKASDDLQKLGIANLYTTFSGRGTKINQTLTLADLHRGNKVLEIINCIKNDVMPKISSVIEQIEQNLYDTDHSKADQFFANLFEQKAVDLTLQFSKRAAMDVLIERLGKSAVKRALKYYGLEQERSLTGQDLAAIAIGASANLTYKDLRKHVPNFDSATEQVLATKLLQLRMSLDCQVIIPTSNMPYKRQLVHDQMVLQYLNEIEEWTAESEEGSFKGLKHYSYAEYLARHVTYALFNNSHTKFPDGILIPIYDKANELSLMSAHHIVSTKGLYGALFKPVRLNEKQNEIYIGFRGTYCKSSILRDISPTETMQNRLFDGPGRYSFTKNQEQIYQNIISQIDDVPNPEIEFLGHSLGAADAMRTMEYFLYKQAESVAPLPVNKLKLNVFNTPGVEPDIAKRFMKSLRKLQIDTDLRYFDVHHDFVQELGSTRLGYWRSHESCPDYLKVSIFKFNRRVEERMMALAKNIFKRMKFNLNKALEAHTFYCLRLHETDDPQQVNSTFIQDVFTNHERDTGITYGQELDKQSVQIEGDELSDNLLTTTCFIGRSIKRKALKAKKYFREYFLPILQK